MQDFFETFFKKKEEAMTTSSQNLKIDLYLNS